MKPEIEIYDQEDEVCNFAVGEDSYTVSFETIITFETIEASFNPATGDIGYEESRKEFKSIRVDTFEWENEDFDSPLIFTREEICNELEIVINRKHD
jgi:hypothetical protein